MVLKMPPQTAQPASASGGESIDKTQAYWKRELERAHKHFNDKWWPRADKLYKTYAKQSEREGTKRKFAMLWANTEVMKPSVYARPPVPQVSRRYRDKDPVGRLAAELLERACSYEFERMNLDSTLRAVRDDLLLPGRGVAWVRYEAEIDEDEPPGPETPEGIEAMQGMAEPQITDHRVVCDYIHYRQFLHGPARRWEEVPWVAKIAYMTAKEGKARFGENWSGVQLDNKADSEGDSSSRDPALENAQEAKATVYEIWSKADKKVFFIAKSAAKPLSVEPPLLDLEGFFPCPKPVYATVTVNSMIPTPDYAYYQDQAEEIDDLTDRIDRLTDSLKLVGFYPAGAEGDVSSALAKALSPDTQNQMIPIASWAAFGERGGSNAIVWLPITDVVSTIKACVELRNQIIQDTYQITGISDILRGSTDAGETATAQSIKAQWGSVRIRDRQQELVRIARDITRMACEIISEQFDPEYILQMSNMPKPQPPAPPDLLPPPPPSGNPEQDQQAQQQHQQMTQQAQQMAQQAQQAFEAESAKYDEAFALLRNDRMRGFRVEVETDSTIQPDEDAEKQRRTEFVTAIGGMLQQAMPMVIQVPELAGLISETLLFTARGFRTGRQLEDQIEQTMTAIQDRIKQQQSQQQPDPNQAMIDAKVKQMEVEAQHKAAMNQMDQEHVGQMNQLEIQKALDKHQTEIGMKQQMAQHDMQMAQQSGELQLNQGKSKLKEQILAEDQQAFLGKPEEQVNGVAQVLQQSMAAITDALTQSNAQVVQSNQQLLSALTAPKVITAPDGRQYTSQTAN